MMDLKATRDLTGDLTICTVSYHSASLLDLNLNLTRELNPTGHFRWIVVDNNNDFRNDDPQRFQLLRGDPCANQGKLRGSYHHAQSLNKALKYVTTRYVLVIDPDFFIIRQNWIRDVLAHMSSRNLSLWGAPYYPHANWKRRYVPAAYCMLIDLEKIAKEKLDFTPELDEYHTLFTYSTSMLLQIRMGNIPKEVSHVEHSILQDIAGVILRNRLIAAPLAKLFPKRFYPNTDISRDTGFKIQKEYGNSRAHRVETLQPSYRSDLFTRKKSVWLNLFAKGYYRLVPEKLSIYPKRRDYSTTLRFNDFGLFDVRGQFGWEEYFWNEQPFAMHIKSGTKKFEDVGHDTLEKILFQLAGKPISVEKQIETTTP
jgi:hypothetical protein